MIKKVRKAVLPVAGLGTRFLPATKAMPKEMLTVVDKPVIQYAVQEAIDAGIEEIIFITGRGKGSLENHFDKPYELSDTLRRKGKTKELEMVEGILPEHVSICYKRQGEPLGLGHAVWCAKSIIGDEPFAVLLPDDIIHSNGETTLKKMVDSYEETGASYVMTQEVSEERVKNYGVLNPKGETMQNDKIRVHSFVEKPSIEEAPSRLAVVGRYIFDPRIFDFLEEKNIGAGGEIQLTDAMDKLAQEKEFYGYQLDGQRFDCGDKVGFQKANLFYALQDDYIGPRLREFLKEMGLENELSKTA